MTCHAQNRCSTAALTRTSSIPTRTCPAGRLSSAGRTSQFERRYASLEHVLPKAIAAQSISPGVRPSDQEAFRQLMLISAKAHGVGTEQDLRDYFRLKPEMSHPALAALVGAGDLVQVSVDGWKRPAYLHKDARTTRTRACRGALEPVRLPDLGVGPDRRLVRHPLPAGDPRAGPPGDPRLLRAPLPVWV
jgi:Winged helix DNA-binding domain